MKTIVGELGLGISGGQKQRILIARALYRKPSILFMDEATSHLDLKNESVINQSISALSITRIIVAHRPSTIASADRVIDLSQTSRSRASIKGEELCKERLLDLIPQVLPLKNRFMALLLKIKQENDFCQQYYLQAPIVLDLLLILQNRLLVTFKSLQDQGETYKEKLIAYNESLIAKYPCCRDDRDSAAKSGTSHYVDHSQTRRNLVNAYTGSPE